MSAIFKKLRFSALVAALLVFFLPWLAVQCNGVTLVTQSGAQVVYGGSSLSGAMADMGKASNTLSPAVEDGDSAGEPESDSSNSGEDPDPAIFIGLALLLLVAAIFVSASALRRKSAPTKLDVILASSAFALVLAQATIGFPVEKAMQEARQKQSADKSEDEESNEITRAMEKAIVIDTELSPWFYLECFFLLTPAFLLFFENKRPQEQNRRRVAYRQPKDDVLA